MAKNTGFSNLTIPEMNLLVEHLKLGPKHLQNKLTKQQFEELLHWGGLDEEEKSQVQDTPIEKVSLLAPNLNSILTSVFGGFLGLSAMLGFDLSQPVRLSIVCALAGLLGAVICFLSFKTTRQHAHQAILDLKIHKIQYRLLKLINKKIDSSTAELLANINSLPNKLRCCNRSEMNCAFETEEETRQWLDHLSGLVKQSLPAIPNKKIYEIYHTDIQHNLAQIRSILLKEAEPCRKLVNATNNYEAKNSIPDPVKKQFSFIEILTAPNLALPKGTFASSWKEKRIPLLLGLLPTVVGAFASFFVFMNGIPTVAKSLEAWNLATFFTHPLARIVELVSMLIITIYFGFFFVYSQKKATQREDEIAYMYQEIIEQETRMVALNQRFQIITKATNNLVYLTKNLELLDLIKSDIAIKN